MNAHDVMKREIILALQFARLMPTSEDELQEAIARVMRMRSIDHEREVVLGDAGRIDFMVGDIGIEVKVGGSANEATRQMLRYAQRDEVRSLILVTTKIQHLAVVPHELNGKAVLCHVVMRAFA